MRLVHLTILVLFALCARARAGEDAAATRLYYDRSEQIVVEVSGPISSGQPTQGVVLASKYGDCSAWMQSRGGGVVGFITSRSYESEFGSGSVWSAFLLFRTDRGLYASGYTTGAADDYYASDCPGIERISSLEDAIRCLPEGPDRTAPAGAILFEVTDKRFVDFVRLAWAKEHESADGLARELLAAHPDSILFRLVAIDAALLREDGNRVTELLATYGAGLTESTDPFVSAAPHYYRQWLDALDAHRQGRNMAEKHIRFFGLRDDHVQRVSKRAYDVLMASIKADDAAFPLQSPLLFRNFQTINFFEIQVRSKMALVESDFLLIQGETEEALVEASRQLPAMCAMLRGSSNIISVLIAVAVTQILEKAHEHIYLSGFTRSDELKKNWLQLDNTFSMLRDAAAAPQPWVHLDLPFDALPEISEAALGNAEEIDIRTRIMVTRWSLLHSATAARHCLLKTGKYPAADKFGELLPDGPDTDPFGVDGAKLLVTSGDTMEWTLYSIGPDGLDDHAVIEYDPTNGTTSRGDITLQVPRQRKYAFPPRGQLKRTRNGILRQFNYVLPPDPFADIRDASYVVGTLSDSLIWSAGPSTDNERWRTGTTDRNQIPDDASVSIAPDGSILLYPERPPHPQFDPTNGIVSYGNVLLGPP